MSSALTFGFESQRPYPLYLTIDPIEGVSNEELYPFVEGLAGCSRHGNPAILPAG